MEHQKATKLTGKYRKSLQALIPRTTKEEELNQTLEPKTVFFDSEDKYIKR